MGGGAEEGREGSGDLQVYFLQWGKGGKHLEGGPEEGVQGRACFALHPFSALATHSCDPCTCPSVSPPSAPALVTFRSPLPSPHPPTPFHPFGQQAGRVKPAGHSQRRTGAVPQRGAAAGDGGGV